MQECDDFPGESLMCLTQFRMFVIGNFKCLDLFLGKESQEFEVIDDFGIFRVDEELVHLIRRSLVDIEPDGLAIGLAEFLSVSFGQKRHRKTIGFLAQFLADQFNAGRDIAPLVLTCDLHDAVAVLIQVKEVVSLHRHIGKLGIGDTFIKSSSDDILVQHVADIEKLADISEPVDIAEVLEPVVVVDHFKAKQLLCLGFQTFEVVIDFFDRDHRTFGIRFRIADQAGTAANQQYRVVSGILESL